jgi:type IV secretory pathway VirB10-like protein
MNIQSTARILIVALAATYCFPAGWAQATTQQPSSPTQNQAPQPQGSSPSPQLQPVAPAEQPQAAPQPPAAQQPQGNATSPQQPVTTYPDASAAAEQGTQTAPDAPQPKVQQNAQPQTEPQGAATAEKVNTAGGAAAKPAGAAIAPAKQHQTRSLLIKIGAFAAAGIAAGTVYALSRGTSSTPPGATSSGATRK